MATILIIHLRINWPNLNFVSQLPYFLSPEDFCYSFWIAGGVPLDHPERRNQSMSLHQIDMHLHLQKILTDCIQKWNYSRQYRETLWCIHRRYKYTCTFRFMLSLLPPPPRLIKKLVEFEKISRPTLAEVGWARAHPCPPVATPVFTALTKYAVHWRLLICWK